MCGMEVPAGKLHYSVSFNEEQGKEDGTVEVTDKVSLLVCCKKCGDSENTYHMFKGACKAADILE